MFTRICILPKEFSEPENAANGTTFKIILLFETENTEFVFFVFLPENWCILIVLHSYSPNKIVSFVLPFLFIVPYKSISMKSSDIHIKSLLKLWFLLLLSFGALALLESCDSDDVKGNLYTFQEKTMGQYLQSRPELFSEFCRILDTTNVMGLLKSYGTFTCFAPDNEAMKAFYLSMGRPDLSDFSMDSIKQIAYDHLILDWMSPPLISQMVNFHIQA